MLVLFDENNRERLRIFREETEVQRKEGIEIDEKDVPVKKGFNTIITRKGDEVEYIYEEIPKSDDDKLEERLAEIEMNFSVSIAELIEKVEKDKADLSLALVESMENIGGMN